MRGKAEQPCAPGAKSETSAESHFLAQQGKVNSPFTPRTAYAATQMSHKPSISLRLVAISARQKQASLEAWGEFDLNLPEGSSHFDFHP